MFHRSWKSTIGPATFAKPVHHPNPNESPLVDCQTYSGIRKQQKQEILKQAIGFFKVLVPLLGTIQSRDALKMWDIQQFVWKVVETDMVYSI